MKEQTKRCTKCGDVKELSEFHKDLQKRDGLDYRCKKCVNTQRIYRHRTKKGLILQIYRHQINGSNKRNYSLPSYTKSELKDWLFNQPLFHELYNNWKISGYKKDLIPICDRTDDYQGYSLSRLQLMTWQENRDKSHQDRRNGINNKHSKAVIQYDLDGNFIKEYHSTMQAQRITGIYHSNIGRCCSGIYKIAGGFKWKYKDV